MRFEPGERWFYDCRTGEFCRTGSSKANLGSRSFHLAFRLTRKRVVLDTELMARTMLVPNASLRVQTERATVIGQWAIEVLQPAVCRLILERGHRDRDLIGL